MAVLGVSNDKLLPNLKFAKMNGFEYPLLCDTDNTVAMLYGAAVRRYDPHRRIAVLVDEKGIIAKVYDPASTGDFAAIVLADVKAMKDEV